MTETGRAAIIGTGSYVPDKVLTNHDLETMVETSDEWIFTRTGIRERRIAAADQATSDLALIAAQRACEHARVSPDELDLIVCATITPDYPLPSTAGIVQDHLGARHAGAFDLQAACSGFVYGVQLAAGYLLGHPRKTVLVVGAETLTRFTNWTDRTSCILFGDGAGAAVMRIGAPGQGVIDGELGSDGSGYDMMITPAGGSRRPPSRETVDKNEHAITIRGREVYKFAVTKMGDLMENALRQNDLRVEDIGMVIPHQVNIRILSAAAERIGLPMDKVYVNIDRYGNTSAASVPIALDEANRKGLLRRGDIVILMGFGGGLSWGSAVLRW